MTRARRHEDDDNEREIGMIEVARRLYPSEPPPFIDHDLSSHVQPGAQREVINSTDSGHWPLPTGSKSKVVCRAWANTQHKFWTYDVRDFRYIVKGFPAVHDGKSWVVYRIWDGEDHDLEESKGFGSRRVAFEYRPDTNPEGIAPEAMFLDRSSRREAFGQRGPRKADGNRTFRQMAAMVKQAERGMGSGPKKNGNQVAKGRYIILECFGTITYSGIYLHVVQQHLNRLKLLRQMIQFPALLVLEMLLGLKSLLGLQSVYHRRL